MQPKVRDGARPTTPVLCALFVLACVPYLVNLGTPPLWDANEPLYAQPPNEVLNWPEGDFLAPTWNGRRFFAHPPLSTWITVPFYAAMGVSEQAERLPMALAAVFVLLATFRLGRLAGGRRVGLFAALVLAATPRFWLFARQLSGDVYLVALLTWAFALALPAVSGGTNLRSLRLANVLVGVGFLAKGPVVLVLYGGSLLLAWWFASPRARLADLRPLRGFLLVIAVGAPWFVYMALRYPEFVGEHFGHYTFGRLVGNIGQRGVFWYPAILAGDAQPWVTVLPFGVVSALRRDRRVATLLPLAAIAWTLLFFTFSAGKRNVYMLPLYPFVAVAVAPMAIAVWDGAYHWSARLGGLAASFGCAAVTAVLVLLAANEPRLRPEVYWPVGLFGLMVLPFLVAGLRGRGPWVAGGAITTLLGAQLAVALAFPALARFRPVPQMAARIRAEQGTPPEPAILYQVPIHSLNFYLGRATRVAEDPADLVAKMEGARTAWVLVPERRFDREGRGLRHELPGAVFEELERRPLLAFRFDASVLGRGRTTRDLLLVRVTLPEDASFGSTGEDPSPPGDER